MKRCLTCGRTYETALSVCPACGASPALVDGIAAHAPALAHSGGGFSPEFFPELAGLESGNFWFRARNELVAWALSKYCPGFSSMLEVGCGTGFVMSGVAQQFPQATLFGSEIFTAGLGFARQRLPGVEFMQMDARSIPYVSEFDVIGAFDVLEHIAEDRQVLAQMHGALRPNGAVVLTVPQHAWLWSATDVYACHERRYSAPDLHAKLADAGFEIVRSTSFVSALLPAMMASRWLQGSKPEADFDATKEFNIAPWMNALLYRLSLAEIALIKLGINLPLGGSRLVVARKK